MSKRTFRNRSSCRPTPKKQAKITSFTQQQHSSKLLRSQDGLKQGRIESFMVAKPRNNVQVLRPKKKSKDCGDMASTSSGGNACLRPATIDLTNVDHAGGEASRSKNLSKSESPIHSDMEIQSAHQCNEVIPNKSELISAKLEDDLDNMYGSSNVTILTIPSSTDECNERAYQEHNETSLDSWNPDLNDSFLNAALSDTSPVKELCESNNQLLPFSLPCSSTDHSLARIRFKITKVSHHGSTQVPMLILHLENIATRKQLECKLCDGWAMMNVAIGDIVNVIGKAEDIEKETITIDSQDNLIIVHPDILLSGTSLSNAIGCRRRAVLNERFKNTEIGESRTSMLIGTIVHTLFQVAAVRKGNMTMEELAEAAKSELTKPQIMRDILLCGSTQSELLSAVKDFIPKIAKFCNEYIRDVPCLGKAALDVKLPVGYKNDTLAIDGNHGTTRFPANIALTEVRDIEENVWSPTYGLKGKIDLSSTCLVKRQRHGKSAKVHMPLELKTGRASHSIEHYVQVAIYSMFSRRRGSVSSFTGESFVPAGLLLYLKSMELSCVPLNRADERELLLIRNQIVSSLTKSLVETSPMTYEPAAFPPVLNDERLCGTCSQLRNCTLISRSVERSQPNQVPRFMSELITANTSHLKFADLNYFKHWLTCTLLETRKSMKDDLTQYYWLRSPAERNQAGSCVHNLVLAGPGRPYREESCYLQAFKKYYRCEDCKFGIFHVGEQVVISGTEPMYIAMASGSVFDISENFITIRTERCFQGYDADMRYCIDKHEWSSASSFNSSFQNLSILMQDTPRSSNLRDLIIKHKRPTFKKGLLDVITRTAKEEIAKMLRGLNRTQRQAIKRVLLSNDYTLVVGMPGSGKTTTIVAMVRILLLCGCRILITSYTHSAIDTLLVKLIKYKVKFLRLGRLNQIHPAVRKFSEEEYCRNIKSPEELDRLYSDANIVGCTCIAASSHPLFSGNSKRSKFDVCIVDEASQISQPSCLAPLFHASRFVLVGDHQQLPPLVRSKKARSIGADESLFRRLTCNEDALCYLTLQYRMNRTIMEISNHVTYEGRLECATEATATAKLSLPNLNYISRDIMQQDRFSLNKKSIRGNSYLLTAVDPDKPVVFIDTSAIFAYEEELDNGLCNKAEADIIKIIVELLLKAGCKSNSIGVIAPFRRQVKLIEEYLSNITSVQVDDVEVSTVDKYQGRDKEVIVMSFVRSRSESSNAKAGELLNDRRRLNVALTRAKRKMVLVGCHNTLQSYEPCKKLLSYLEDNDMIISLST